MRELAKVYADGRELVVTNEGGELQPRNFEPGKYYVLVKALRQYFSPSERDKRVTVFEQNHDVSQFYFDIPLKPGTQPMAERRLKRYIFTSLHSLPYIVQRVEIPKHKIDVRELSAIDANCKDLLLQCEKIEDASRRKNFFSLSPTLKGALLTEVNEGPIKMAEVFLSDNNDEVKNQDSRMTLRALFRRFIQANAEGLQAHQQYANDNPILMPLQEMLYEGLNKLNSALQPYLS
jgi:hypothetical protein